eukprot:c21662_g1_i1.p1 GENE.c21662_g1_i1~~c21662_g1_i1.p1  ORF type:complete len:182 (-),score=41.36 c21662_g1_i1:111-590(-)
MALPAAKIFTVLVKQLSKPIANQIKHAAASRESLHTGLARFGKLALTMEYRLNKFLLPATTPKSMPLPGKEGAVQRGSDLLGEVVIFTIAVTVTVAEYTRSKKKEAKKEAAKDELIHSQFDGLRNEIRALGDNVAAMAHKVEHFEGRIVELEANKQKKR